jgi:Sulfotransferase family
MIISEQYGFIFVHIPKTAGLAVTDAFGKYGRPRGRTIWRSISRRLPFQESPASAHFRVHEPVSKMIAKLSRPVFDSFVSFSVIRNPFDHAVSHYEYMKQFRIESTAQKVGEMSFRDYLEYRMKPPFWNDTIFARMPDQCYYLMDGDGKIAVNRLVRFEQLGTELESLSRDLKLPDFNLRHVNKTQAAKKPMDDYFDATTIDLVRRIYDRDFDALGYSRDYPVVAKS